MHSATPQYTQILKSYSRNTSYPWAIHVGVAFLRCWQRGKERGSNFVAAAIARFILEAHARHRCTRKPQRSLSFSLSLSRSLLHARRRPLSSVLLYLYRVPSLRRDSPGSRTVITGASKGLVLALADSFVRICETRAFAKGCFPTNRHAKLGKKLGFERGARRWGG